MCDKSFVEEYIIQCSILGNLSILSQNFEYSNGRHLEHKFEIGNVDK
jgi:hypothetical protein